MKRIILIAAVLSATQTFGQLTTEDKQTFTVAGFNAGYSKNITAGLSLGVRTGNVYLSVAQIISLTSDATTPKIFTGNVGYNIGSLQPFVSYGYQTIGKEREQFFKGTSDEFLNAWRLGYGLSYYFRNAPVSVTVQRQGKVNNIGVGMYKSF